MARADNCYVSGPHVGDYYLLSDEQAVQTLELRLAAHSEEAAAFCEEPGSCASVYLVEVRIDEAEKGVWYLFEIRV